MLQKAGPDTRSPKSTEQLQQVLRVANQYAVPLWTFSRGKNLGYGGPAPRVSGSVALDLHRMDRIIEVNDEFHYAVVEPGVTFIQLYQYCVEHGKKVWPSTPSLGWGSVVGNVSTPPGHINRHADGIRPSTAAWASA